MYIEDEAVVKENVGKREDEASVDPPKRVVLRETTFPLPDTLPIPTALQSLLQCNPHKKTGATEHGTA